MKVRALILDRDGTIIQHLPYLADPNEVRLLPGVRKALGRAWQANLRLFLHSNQSGVGRGLFSLRDVEACNRRMLELLGCEEKGFERMCIAPEHPKAPPHYRKPSPKFAQELMREEGFHPEEICYIGDRGSDLATAHAAGTRGVGVATGLDDLRGELAELGLTDRYPVFDSLDDAIRYLIAAP